MCRAEGAEGVCVCGGGGGAMCIRLPAGDSI